MESALTKIDFVRIVLESFPQLKPDFDEWEYLTHLQMGDFKRFIFDAMQKGDTKSVRAALQIVHDFLVRGDTEMKNVVYVSFLEHLDFDDPIHARVGLMMSSELRKGRQDVLDYLNELLKDDRPPRR